MEFKRKPLYVVKFYGFLIFTVGILNLGIGAYSGQLSDTTFMIAILVTSTWYIAIGIGLMKQDKVGLSLLRGLLWLVGLGYPIGTKIAKSCLAYLRDHKIDDYFK